MVLGDIGIFPSAPRAPQDFSALPLTCVSTLKSLRLARRKPQHSLTLLPMFLVST